MRCTFNDIMRGSVYILLFILSLKIVMYVLHSDHGLRCMCDT